MIALLYNYGIYWDLNEKVPKNRISGIYYYTPGGEKTGMTIVYPNGKKATAYYKCKDNNEALEKVINGKE